MSMKKGIAYSAAGLLGLVAVGTTVLAVSPNLAAQAQQTVGATKAMFGGDHRGWGRGHRGHGLMRVCHGAKGDKVDHMIVFVENFMEFSSEQQAAWDGLATALRSGQKTVVAACDELKAEGRPETAPEKLALVEQALQTGLTTLQQVRPAFDKFYATLSDKQKKALDDLSQHRRR